MSTPAQDETSFAQHVTQLGLRPCLHAVPTLSPLIVETLVQLEASGVREPTAPITYRRREVSSSTAARLARRVSLADT